MHSITEEDVKNFEVEIQKSMFLSRPLLERNCIRGSDSIENISFARNCDIKTNNAKSVTDASMWVMFISKNSDTLEIERHSLLNSPIITLRYGFQFRSTELFDKPHS